MVLQEPVQVIKRLFVDSVDIRMSSMFFSTIDCRCPPDRGVW